MKLVFSFIAGVCLTLLVIGLTKPSFLATQPVANINMEKQEKGESKYQNLKILYDVLKSDYNEIKKEFIDLQTKSNEHFSFLSSLFWGGIDVSYETIGNTAEGNMVIYSEKYKTLTESIQHRKVYLLYLFAKVKHQGSQTIEFWSDKNHAQAYIDGDFQTNEIGGWIGYNSRFGIYQEEENGPILYYVLSTHERDPIPLWNEPKD
ncbi:hypothetical protein GCM10008967_31910 [Bacillus carboniphilus]|uniref:Uncharacterized protein n=1 Tax=Bacillus carboniphilus TaxID=86663 RepID=A0ABN0WIX9_9BACI